MSKLESIKKSSKIICIIGNFCQILFSIITGLMLIGSVILFAFKNKLNAMIIEKQASFDLHNMGKLAEKYASEGKVSEGFIVFAISTMLYSLIIVIIMHFVVKVFQRFCEEYSPFLLEIVKDFKKISVLVVILISTNSLGLAVIVAFVLWTIIQIYEYGCELQNQMDEIL